MKRKFRVIILIIIITLGFLFIENNWIGITRIDVKSKKLPVSFIGLKIVHLSDLHNKEFGKNQRVLLNKIRLERPDIIVFTGDLVDSRRYNEEPSLELMEECVKIAPVFYVTGNHEERTGKSNELSQKLKKLNVNVLKNSSYKIKKGKSSIYILGIDDPTFYRGIGDDRKRIDLEIQKSLKDVNENSFKILLSHRPEQFLVYSNKKMDIVFSGHAHGGQVRLPFIGGLIAPNQGFNPKYTSGKYEMNNSVMIVSRGLGNSLAPIRIFNRPEIICVTLSR